MQLVTRDFLQGGLAVADVDEVNQLGAEERVPGRATDDADLRRAVAFTDDEIEFKIKD